MSQLANMAAPAQAVQGKYAEGKIRDELRRRGNEDSGFDWERNYDARSSMGRIPRRAGDFTYYWQQPLDDRLLLRHRGHGVIEVKQVKHDFRLPRKNFDPDGWGILVKREMAGGKIVVIVFHSTTKKWRVVPFGWFKSLRDAKSWDLTTWPMYDKAQAVLDAAGLCE